MIQMRDYSLQDIIIINHMISILNYAYNLVRGLCMLHQDESILKPLAV